jgi:hypothetical protein
MNNDGNKGDSDNNGKVNGFLYGTNGTFFEKKCGYV